MTQHRFSLHALMAGHGDCIWVEYGVASAPCRLLIDGGTAGTYKRLAASLAPGARLDLLVVTHVDSDHIAGVLPLLEGEHARSFAGVLFNGRRHLRPDLELEELGPVQGERLTSLIRLHGLPWNKPFGGKHIATGEDGTPVKVELEGGALLTILSPGRAQLENLFPVWDREVRKAGLEPGFGEQDRVDVPIGFEVLGALSVDALADERFEEDTTEANGSSIAFLMEYKGKRVLFGADAHPSVLTESIRRLTGGAPMEVDVFKLPHHGSKANVSEELVRLVPAQHYVFSTNGAYYGHPDRQAVARVIKYGARGANLVFNCLTEHNKIWNRPALMETWGYSVTYGEADTGVSLHLLSLPR